MDCEEFLKSMETRGYIESPSEAQDCMHRLADRARKITSQMNGAYRTQEEIRALFRELTGREICEGFVLFPPFYTDCGRNIRIGNDVFINAGCCFQDQGGIFVGDGVLIGHQVVLATLNHDLAPAKRKNMFHAPIIIGNNVWIGAHATILAGRTLHPDNMAAGPASYGLTDTMGRMHSDAQFAGSSSVPAHVEMMGLIGMGNNPMVGASVAVAVAVQEAMTK